jgi:hypothetical protein
MEIAFTSAEWLGLNPHDGVKRQQLWIEWSRL